jgi:hypothetical protein
MLCQERLSTVLNDGYPSRFGEGHDFVHLARIAKQMRNHDSASALAECRFDGFGGDVPCSRIDLGKCGNRALVQNRRKRTHVGDRAGDDLVSGLRVNGCNRGVDRGSPGRACVRVLNTKLFGKLVLKLFDESALGTIEDATRNDLAQIGEFGIAQVPAGGVLIRREPHVML